jgi:hypothetical protein
MAVRVCESAHCSGADAEINQICKDLGWPINHPVLTRDAHGPCTCSCSCLAHATPVESGDGTFRAIETYKVGDSVMAAGLDLSWKPLNVEFSGGTTGASKQKYTVVVSFTGTAIAVTSDHLFLCPDGSLKAADRLTIKDQLVTPAGKPVKIDGVYIGDYYAGFHHIATSKKAPDASLDGHLLNTHGVVSADYTLQIFYRAGELGERLTAGHAELAIVGSPDYVARNGRASLDGPVAPQGVVAMVGANAAEQSQGTFVPAQATLLRIPPDAAPFLPQEEARKRAAFPKRRWNDPMSREWTESLLHLHHYFYSDVVFTLDWANDEVNAYAWVENGTRHVAILGGLVRDVALELEGISVVVAHEIGHHYGGNPAYPQGLSCEGQSDYYGVGTVMRNVWFGEDFTTKTDLGIAQMADFFGVPNSPTVPGGTGNCSHPPGACRIATYHSAVKLSGRPPCAN